MTRRHAVRRAAAIALLGAGCLLLTAGAPGQHRKRKSKPPAHHLSAAEAYAASKKKAQLRGQLGGLKPRLRKLHTRIRAHQHQAHVIRGDIHGVEARIDSARSRLRAIRGRIVALNGRHDEIVRRLDGAMQRLAARRGVLAARLRQNYMRGDATYLTVLVRSRSVNDLLARGYYVRRIVVSDEELIAAIRQDEEQIREAKRSLEGQQARARALGDEYEAQKADLNRNLQEKQVILAGVQHSINQDQSALDELERESVELSSRIRDLSAMLRRRQAEQWAAAHPSTGGRTHGRRGARPYVAVFRGGFLRPVPGRVTSGFGGRFHPILHRYRRHTGVDFAAHYGDSIHAAAAGVVIMAQHYGGYGNCVVIDHGSGVTTLYGHCSAILVSEGETVRQGQVIARVGATGLATGPHLHFEVRHNGVPVAPPF